MTLEETAARAGGHQWLEQAVWRVLGGWAATAGDPGAAILLDTHAQHAAWRARQWWERLPVLAVIDRDALVRSPSAGLTAALGHLDSEAGPATTVGRLAAAYRFLLPRLVAVYQREAKLLSDVSESPAKRTLAQVGSDVAGDWCAGESFLQTVLTGAAAIDEAAAIVARLEQLSLGRPSGEAVQ